MATTKTAKRRKKKPAPKPKEAQPPRLRLDKVTFEGFKGFEEPFTLEIPPPLAEGDLDITVIGGVNGTGKTAVLEGICLSFLMKAVRAGEASMTQELLARVWASAQGATRSETAWFEAAVNANRSAARLTCDVLHEGKALSVATELVRDERAVASSAPHELTEAVLLCRGAEGAQAAQEGLRRVVLAEPEPVLAPPVLYFHSYRKVAEWDPELADLVHASRRPVSSFKQAVINALLGRGGLVEGQAAHEGRAALDQLNALMERLVGGRIKDQVRTDGNELDIRVQPLRGGESIPFDALSSGQKEIVSTLFLIWQYSRKQPCIVLIDEPELHLHPQWHYEFVRQLEDLAPHNQYIIATHSGEIARSVEQDRIFLLSR